MEKQTERDDEGVSSVLGIICNVFISNLLKHRNEKKKKKYAKWRFYYAGIPSHRLTVYSYRISLLARYDCNRKK
jgi:hypothetical protein